jgi:hypothetical protein
MRDRMTARPPRPGRARTAIGLAGHLPLAPRPCRAKCVDARPARNDQRSATPQERVAFYAKWTPPCAAAATPNSALPSSEGNHAGRDGTRKHRPKTGDSVIHIRAARNPSQPRAAKAVTQPAHGGTRGLLLPSRIQPPAPQPTPGLRSAPREPVWAARPPRVVAAKPSQRSPARRASSISAASSRSARLRPRNASVTAMSNSADCPSLDTT